MTRRIRGGLRAVLVVRRVQLVPAIVATMLLSVACGDRGDGLTAGGGDEACEFAGSTSAPKIDPAGGPFEITEVVHEVGQDDCEETVTFQFGSLPTDAQPGYHVFYRGAPLRGPDGREIKVDGEATLEIVLFEASGGTEPALARNDGLVVDIVKPPEIPGGSLWLLGLEEEHTFTVRFERTPRPSLVVSVGAVTNTSGSLNRPPHHGSSSVLGAPDGDSPTGWNDPDTDIGGNRDVVLASTDDSIFDGAWGGLSVSEPPIGGDSGSDAATFGLDEVTYTDTTVMSGDGTRLQAQVWSPPGVSGESPAPVLLVVTPYTGLFGEGVPYTFTDLVQGAWARGWSYGEVTLRGYGTSEGCGDLFGPEEQADVLAATRWAASASFSDGRVAMVGWSYDGWAVLSAAAQHAPIVAGYVVAAPTNLHEVLYDDGVPLLNLAVLQAEGVEGGDVSARMAIPTVAFPPLAPNEPTAMPTCVADRVAGFPASADPSSAYVLERSLHEELGRATVPMLFDYGFVDHNVASEDLSGYLHYGGPRWGRFSQADHRGVLRPDTHPEALDFLEAHVEGGKPSLPAVQVQDSAGHLRTEAAYPPADASDLTLPVRPGKVVDDPDLGSFAIDPTRQAFTSTRPFTQRTRLAGQLTVDLDLTSPPAALIDDPGAAARAIGLVYDVSPDGHARLVSRGAALVRSNPLRNRAYASLDTQFTDWVVEQGHRLLLVISGTDRTRYERTSGQLRASSYDILAGRWTIPVLTEPRARLLDGGVAQPFHAVDEFDVSLTDVISHEVDVALPRCRGCGVSPGQPADSLAVLADVTIELGPAQTNNPAGPPSDATITVTIPEDAGEVVLDVVAQPDAPIQSQLYVSRLGEGVSTVFAGPQYFSHSRSITTTLVGKRLWDLGPSFGETVSPEAYGQPATLIPGTYQVLIINQQGPGANVDLTVSMYPAPLRSGQLGEDPAVPTPARRSE